MTALRFVIIQHVSHYAVAPDRHGGRLGVLEPVNMDGFYSDQESAEDVARYMAGCRPDLETLVLSVVAKVAP